MGVSGNFAEHLMGCPKQFVHNHEDNTAARRGPQNMDVYAPQPNYDSMVTIKSRLGQYGNNWN